MSYEYEQMLVRSVEEAMRLTLKALSRATAAEARVEVLEEALID